MHLFRQFLRDESGATAIEYALYLGLIAVVIVGSLNSLREGMIEMYDFVSSEVNDNIDF
ncbi:MAG: Flp family type IVb pilin [Kiloniellales bacterium]|nr:Flp family type IVb pilin [Kiloniellales bacterium]